MSDDAFANDLTPDISDADQHEIADLTIGELRCLVNALERARTVLGNMALENEGAIFRRWPMLMARADARNLLPEIDAVLKSDLINMAKR